MTPRRYDVRHVTRYSYDEEVSASYSRAHLVPRDCPGQFREHDQLVVEPAPGLVSERQDFYGNPRVYVEVLTPHTELVVTATSRVRLDRTAIGLTGDDPATPDALRVSWQDAVASLRGAVPAPGGADRGIVTAASGSEVDGEELVRAADFRLPSPHVPLSGPVREFAAAMFTPGRPVGQALADLVGTIHREFRYHSGVTSVSTTLEEVLALREGVCQDFAHLAVGALRSVGLPARYVSGYLETRPPPGEPRLVGADASHAWASVLLPGAGWVDIDPTNDRVIDNGYVVTAWGRDYADVPPLKGVIYTESKKSRLSVAVDVVPVLAPSEGTS